MLPRHTISTFIYLNVGKKLLLSHDQPLAARSAMFVFFEKKDSGFAPAAVSLSAATRTLCMALQLKAALVFPLVNLRPAKFQACTKHGYPLQSSLD